MPPCLRAERRQLTETKRWSSRYSSMRSAFALAGHDVVAADVDEKTTASLAKGKATFSEPWLEEALARSEGASPEDKKPPT